MNEQPTTNVNSDDEAWAMRVETTARDFAYPPTPDLARAVAASLRPRRSRVVYRQLTQVALILALIGTGLMAVPEIRASVIEVLLQLGAVRIFVGEPTTTPTATIPATRPGATPRPTMTPQPTPFVSVLDLPGGMSLADAKTQFPKLVQLPTVPTDLGDPDRIFAVNGMLTFVWTQPDAPAHVRLVMAVAESKDYAVKLVPWEPMPTRVGGQLAYWFEQSHLLSVFSETGAGEEVDRSVTMHVLLWERGPYTYRLETPLTMEEAVKIAESVP